MLSTDTDMVQRILIILWYFCPVIRIWSLKRVDHLQDLALSKSALFLCLIALGAWLGFGLELILKFNKLVVVIAGAHNVCSIRLQNTIDC